MNASKFFGVCFLILLTHSKLSACRCDALGFCENLTPTSTVVEAKAIHIYNSADFFYRFIDVEITGFLYGLDTLSYDTLTLEVANTSCDEPTFFASDSGDSFVFMIEELSEAEEALHPTFRYGICHVRYLSIEGDSVMGLLENLDLSRKEDTLAYASFKDNIENVCELLLMTAPPKPFSNVLRVFPNPTQNELNVRMNRRQDLEYSIYSNIGQRIISGKKVQQQDFKIDITEFPPGIYYLQFQIGETVFYEKILKL